MKKKLLLTFIAIGIISFLFSPLANKSIVFAQCDDTIPPQIEFTSPAVNPGEVIEVNVNNINIKGNAWDNLNIVSMEWQVENGSNIDTGQPEGTITWEEPGQPWVFKWSMNVQLYEGDNTISVIAYDNNGLFSTEQLTVRYLISGGDTCDDTIPPQIEITEITLPDGTAVNPDDEVNVDNINVKGNAWDNLSLVNMEWQVENGSNSDTGKPEGTISWEEPGFFEWSMNVQLYTGDNIISVIGYDSNGLSSTEQFTVTYLIPGGDEPPEDGGLVLDDMKLTFHYFDTYDKFKFKLFLLNDEFNVAQNGFILTMEITNENYPNFHIIKVLDYSEITTDVRDDIIYFERGSFSDGTYIPIDNYSAKNSDPPTKLWLHAVDFNFPGVVKGLPKAEYVTTLLPMLIDSKIRITLDFGNDKVYSVTHRVIPNRYDNKIECYE
jgi:hypothetical protein